MAQNRTIHTKYLGENRYRDLNVYYSKGGINYWDYSTKPKGIYFASQLYTLSGPPGQTIRSWSTGQKGDGYICVTELDRYRPSELKAVIARVEARADAIHDLLDGNGGDALDLTAYLRGESSVVTPIIGEVA